MGSAAERNAIVASLAGALDGPVLPVAALTRLEQSLGPRPAGAPGLSTERHEALLAAATRLISGYMERTGGRIRITASVEDIPTARSHSVSADGSSAIDALRQLAGQLSSHPNQPTTSNETALRSYSIGVESPPAARADDLENAVHADPDFGPAWNALVRLDLARGDGAAAQDAILRAHEHKLDALSLADLDLEAANLLPNPAGRIDAMRKLAALTPGDIGLLRLLAEAETIAGRFAESAADWKKLTIIFPADASSWNALGYTLSYAGDSPGLRAALSEYASVFFRKIPMRTILSVTSTTPFASTRTPPAITRRRVSCSSTLRATAISTRPPGRSSAPETRRAPTVFSSSSARRARSNPMALSSSSRLTGSTARAAGLKHSRCCGWPLPETRRTPCAPTAMRCW